MIKSNNAKQTVNVENPRKNASSGLLTRRSRLRKSASFFVATVIACSLCVPTISGAYAENDMVETTVVAAPTFAGYGIVDKYINGNHIPTLDELDMIDFTALRAWDAELAKKLEALKASLEESAAAVQPGEGEDGEGSAENADSSNNDVGSDQDGTGDANASEPEGADPAIPTDDELDQETISSEQPSAAVMDASQYPQWSYSGDTSFVMTHYTDNMNAQKLVAVIGEPAREVAQEYGVKASEMIGLAIAKSFSGTSYMAQAPIRNLFGSTAYEAVEVMDYDEFGVVQSSTSGTQYIFSDELCTYSTYKGCLEDHAYRVANGIEAAIPDDGTWGGAQGSLTDRVMSTIMDYDLARYDEPLSYETTGPLTIQVWDAEVGASVLAEASLADLVAEATSHLGVPYVWGGTTPAGFDCSGLVQYAYANALQMAIPRTTVYQCLRGADVDFRDLHMGDLVFFTNKEGVCTHVGMYLAEGCYIEAPHEGAEVQITMMDEKRPAFAKRLIQTQPAAKGAGASS